MSPHFLVPGAGPIKCSHTISLEKIMKTKTSNSNKLAKECKRCCGAGALRVVWSDSQKIVCPDCDGTGVKLKKFLENKG